MTYVDGGRSPYGERGLKSVSPELPERDRRRSPYGERGLKSWEFVVSEIEEIVAPRMGSVD